MPRRAKVKNLIGLTYLSETILNLAPRERSKRDYNHQWLVEREAAVARAARYGLGLDLIRRRSIVGVAIAGGSRSGKSSIAAMCDRLVQAEMQGRSARKLNPVGSIKLWTNRPPRNDEAVTHEIRDGFDCYVSRDFVHTHLGVIETLKSDWLRYGNLGRVDYSVSQYVLRSSEVNKALKSGYDIVVPCHLELAILLKILLNLHVRFIVPEWQDHMEEERIQPARRESWSVNKEQERRLHTTATTSFVDEEMRLYTPNSPFIDSIIRTQHNNLPVLEIIGHANEVLSLCRAMHGDPDWIRHESTESSWAFARFDELWTRYIRASERNKKKIQKLAESNEPLLHMQRPFAALRDWGLPGYQLETFLDHSE